MLKKILKSATAMNGARGKKTLVNAYNEKCFWVHNGPVLSNLVDLKRALRTATAKQYEYHVDKKHNDFASWVEFVLMDKSCADALRKAGSKSKAVDAVDKALDGYAY